jgi:hypothetical protein
MSDRYDYGSPEGDYLSPRQDIVNVYRDRERVGGFGDVMATTMAFTKKYGKDFERLNRMMARLQPEDRAIAQLEGYYMEVDKYLSIPVQNGMRTVVALFRKAPRNIYKNPQMFLLGWLMYVEGLYFANRAIKETQQTEISLVDVIRYQKLVQRLDQQQ